MTLINRFEGSCGTFGKGKNPSLSTTLGQFAHKIIIIIIINNHGMDVSMNIITI
jgi:hypothetical protein